MNSQNIISSFLCYHGICSNGAYIMPCRENVYHWSTKGKADFVSKKKSINPEDSSATLCFARGSAVVWSLASRCRDLDPRGNGLITCQVLIFV